MSGTSYLRLAAGNIFGAASLLCFRAVLQCCLPACLSGRLLDPSHSVCKASIKRSAQASSTYVHTYTQLLADSRKKLDCYNYDFHVCTLTATMLSNGPCILCVVQQSSRENKTEREREKEREFVEYMEL